MVSGKITQYSNGFQYVDGILQFVPTPEGYYDFTQQRYVYNLKDHLGNNRVSFYHNPTTQKLEILTESHYYPFGMEQENPRFAKNNGEYKYKYNGKEFQEDLGLDWYDYGTRNYDASLGRWMSVDKLAEKYPNISPYVYVANNPINAIDPDGRLIIFINGMHGGDGGKRKYWNGLDRCIMKRVGDNHARYYDGAIGGATTPVSFGGSLFARGRRLAGKRMAYNQAETIFNNLGDGETIKIATHSMGGAYGKGFVQGLKKYAKENDIDITGLIEFEVDLAPFQPDSQEAQTEDVDRTIVVAHEGDIVAGSKSIDGAENNVTRKDKKSGLSEHSVDSFTQEEINQYVPQSQNNRSGSSVWEQKPDKE